jgi:cell division protein FtsB
MNTKTLKKRAAVFVVLAGIVFIAFLKVYQVISVDLLMQDLLTLEQTRNGLLDTTQHLQTKVNKLSNIDRISKKARDQYQLVNNSDQVMFIKIDDFEKLEKMKKQFARKNKKEDAVINLAGVQ